MGSDGQGKGGGAAAQAGSRFEARVAAWYCVRMVAGAGAQPPLQLPTGTRLRFVRCQTEAPVDDVLVETDQTGFIFIQAKSGLRLEAGENSPFRSALDQFTRLWKACTDRGVPGLGRASIPAKTGSFWQQPARPTGWPRSYRDYCSDCGTTERLPDWLLLV
jgi:hypothetical protein